MPGAIDILFNCAGFVHQGTLLDATEDEWELAFELNARSMFRTMQAFLPGMLARGRGVILNMASVSSSLKGVPNRFIYSATKAAVIGMTKSVATDYVTHGIRCNCLCPGTVHDAEPGRTHRGERGAGRIGRRRRARRSSIVSRWGGLGTPEEIAALAVYLASDAAQFITGQAVVIDGGLTLVEGDTHMKLLRYGPSGAEKPAMLAIVTARSAACRPWCAISTASRCRTRR